jgi:hypothetical protein
MLSVMAWWRMRSKTAVAMTWSPKTSPQLPTLLLLVRIMGLRCLKEEGARPRTLSLAQHAVKTEAYHSGGLGSWPQRDTRSVVARRTRGTVRGGTSNPNSVPSP